MERINTQPTWKEINLRRNQHTTLESNPTLERVDTQVRKKSTQQVEKPQSTLEETQRPREISGRRRTEDK